MDKLSKTSSYLCAANNCNNHSKLNNYFRFPSEL